jgi:hypothetical protein
VRQPGCGRAAKDVIEQPRQCARADGILQPRAHERTLELPVSVTAFHLYVTVGVIVTAGCRFASECHKILVRTCVRALLPQFLDSVVVHLADAGRGSCPGPNAGERVSPALGLLFQPHQVHHHAFERLALRPLSDLLFVH